MRSKTTYDIEEPLMLQELILGLLAAVGILLMVVDEVIGMMLVILGILSVGGIYFYRFIKTFKNRGEVIYCCFSWLNNGTMILAVAGILMLMLMTAHHRLIFYLGLVILAATMLANFFLRMYKLRGIGLLTAQIRLVVALVLLLIFFLL